MKNRGITLKGGAAALALGLAVAAQAQPPAVVGPAQLRDFQLPGTVTRPAEQPAPAQPQPAPAAEPPQRSERAAPAPLTPARQPEPAARSEPRPEAAPARPAEPAAEAPAAAAPQAETAPQPALAPPTPAPAPPPAAAAPRPVEEQGGWSVWTFGLPAALLALLAFAAMRRRRARLAAPPEIEVDTPPTAAAPPPPPHRPIPRARLEIGFVPQRTILTNEGVTIPFVMTMRNAGDAPASNVRRAVRIFNAGPSQDRDIQDFFAAAVPTRHDASPITLQPGDSVELSGEAVMPLSEVRQVVVEGRWLFIPMVAFNILYDRGDGRTGQTSKSWLIGTEKPNSDKMAPFRLDLGPRIYRTVGQREGKIAQAV